MHDPVFRENLVYIILTATAIVGAIVLVRHRYRSYWRKLRQTGNPRAKEREMMLRNRKRR